MDWIRTVRAIGGLLSIIVLLALLVADFIYTNRILPPNTVFLLLGLIGTLLGIDMISERLPLEITIEDKENGDNNGG